MLFEIGQYAEARRSLERALALEHDCAHSTYHLALVMEHTGQLEEAEKLFAKAARLSPELYPLPIRIGDAEFEAAAEQALKDLPEPIHKYTENCPVIIEDLPSEELVKQEYVSPQVLGLFLGVPATEPGASPTLGTAAAQRHRPDPALQAQPRADREGQRWSWSSRSRSP